MIQLFVCDNQENTVMDEKTIPDIIAAEASAFGLSLVITWADGKQDDVNIETITNNARFESVLEFNKPEDQQTIKTFRSVQILPHGKGVYWSTPSPVTLDKGTLYILANIERGKYNNLSTRIEDAINARSPLSLQYDELFCLTTIINRDKALLVELQHELLKTYSLIEKSKKTYRDEKDKKKGALKAAKVMGWNRGVKSSKSHDPSRAYWYQQYVEQGLPPKEAMRKIQQDFAYPTFGAAKQSVKRGQKTCSSLRAPLPADEE